MKAIETQYKGYRFRSRLEARWAVFFDELGVSWEYEIEGYDLGEAGWYLPDFRIHTPFGSAFVEVKPMGEVPPEARSKADALAASGAGHVIIVSGDPYDVLTSTVASGYVVLCFPRDEAVPTRDPAARDLLLGVIDESDYVLYARAGLFLVDLIKNYPEGTRIRDHLRRKTSAFAELFITDNMIRDQRRAREIAKRARSARFEHGESGVPDTGAFRKYKGASE